jgi:phage terminase small subunit
MAAKKKRRPPKRNADKRLAFVREYLVDGNGAQAAIRAGYSSRTARQQASELLTKPDIAKAIAQGRKKLQKKAGITREQVIQGLRREADGQGPDTNSKARVSALTQLGKHLGMFTERKELSGPDGGPIQITGIEIVPAPSAGGSEPTGEASA